MSKLLTFRELLCKMLIRCGNPGLKDSYRVMASKACRENPQAVRIGVCYLEEQSDLPSDENAVCFFRNYSCFQNCPWLYAITCLSSHCFILFSNLRFWRSYAHICVRNQVILYNACNHKHKSKEADKKKVAGNLTDFTSEKIEAHFRHWCMINANMHWPA